MANTRYMIAWGFKFLKKRNSDKFSFDDIRDYERENHNEFLCFYIQKQKF
ncbi:hypothetical protein [Campylobacter majalis]